MNRWYLATAAIWALAGVRNFYSGDTWMVAASVLCTIIFTYQAFRK